MAKAVFPLQIKDLMKRIYVRVLDRRERGIFREWVNFESKVTKDDL